MFDSINERRGMLLYIIIGLGLALWAYVYTEEKLYERKLRNERSKPVRWSPDEVCDILDGVYDQSTDEALDEDLALMAEQADDPRWVADGVEWLSLHATWVQEKDA